MGTNYYLKQDVCPHCGRGDGDLHIGKSSGGWVFALHVYPSEWEEGPKNWEEWKERIFAPNSVIVDEYGTIITPAEMVDTVTKRNWNRTDPHNPEWLSQNHAVEGPNGLARSAIDGHSCISHGEGTWDCHSGEFS